MVVRNLLAVFIITTACRAGDARHAKAIRTTEHIVIDGVLDEQTWTQNPDIGPFVEREPRSGAEPTEQTKVWVAYDNNALYIAVRCLDDHPEKIVAKQMIRDGRMRDDDQLEVLIDTFNDGHSAYYFATNPAGSLQEGRITESAGFNLNWDAIWYLRCRIDKLGWTAEFKIPFKTLAFNPHNTSWGFNVQRTLVRTREVSRWASPSFDVQFWQIALAGSIDGIEGISKGIGLDVKPYGLGGFSRDVTQPIVSRSLHKAGADIFYRVTPNLTSTTTFNTDFAETEVDTRQINLTQYPLFYPEKRAFFLEDAGVFDFAPSGSLTPGGAQNPDFLPFFSRQIGLVNGQPVPITAGTKLTGKIGRFDVGLMDIETRDSDAAPGRNFAVGRVKANFFKQSYIGALFTSGEPTGTTTNTLGGVDLRLSTANFLGTSKNFSITAFGSKTHTGNLKGRDSAWGVDISYPNDRYVARYQWRVIGQNYDPALGFVARPATRFSDIRLEFRPRPDFWIVRQMFHVFEYTSYFNLAYHAPETRRVLASPLDWQFQNGGHIELDWMPEFERLFVPFEIHTGVFIPPGAYWFQRGRVDLSTSENQPLLLEATWGFGAFYTGKEQDLSTTLTWKKSRHVTTSFGLQQYFVDLPQGPFNTRLALYRLDYAFTPFLSLSSFVQYDTDSRNLGLQSRLRWIVKPGNELFFVVNHAWQRDPLDRFLPVTTNVEAKLNYTFRF